MKPPVLSAGRKSTIANVRCACAAEVTPYRAMRCGKNGLHSPDIARFDLSRGACQPLWMAIMVADQYTISFGPFQPTNNHIIPILVSSFILLSKHTSLNRLNTHLQHSLVSKGLTRHQMKAERVSMARFRVQA